MRQSPVTRSRQRKEATGATSARNRARAESRLGSRTPAVEHTKRSSPFGAVYSQIHARARHICIGLRTAPRLLPFRSLSPFRPFRSDILYHPVLLCSWLFIFTSPFRSLRSNTIIQYAPFRFQHGFFSLYAHLSSSRSTYFHSVRARARPVLTFRLKESRI